MDTYRSTVHVLRRDAAVAVGVPGHHVLRIPVHHRPPQARRRALGHRREDDAPRVNPSHRSAGPRSTIGVCPDDHPRRVDLGSVGGEPPDVLHVVHLAPHGDGPSHVGIAAGVQVMLQWLAVPCRDRDTRAWSFVQRTPRLSNRRTATPAATGTCGPGRGKPGPAPVQSPCSRRGP